MSENEIMGLFYDFLKLIRSCGDVKGVKMNTAPADWENIINIKFESKGRKYTLTLDEMKEGK